MAKLDSKFADELIALIEKHQPELRPTSTGKGYTTGNMVARLEERAVPGADGFATPQVTVCVNYNGFYAREQGAAKLNTLTEQQKQITDRIARLQARFKTAK